MSDSDLEIRPLAATDSLADLTALLHRAYARLGNMGLNYTAVDQSVETTKTQLCRGVCFVAIAGNEMVATIGVRPPTHYPQCPWYGQSHVCIANRFAVAPELQGRGIGSAMLSRAERWAAEKKYSELAVDTAEPATHLIEFYARRGYRTIGQVDWPGKTYRSVVLSKTIAALPAMSDRIAT
ncbi:MAG TPA: GNAT family N-acetyltransferase [Pirellulales bacterium]|nr:GNAT family N-acetyltransferase [Pirellulales bacterium]